MSGRKGLDGKPIMPIIGDYGDPTINNPGTARVGRYDDDLRPDHGLFCTCSLCRPEMAPKKDLQVIVPDLTLPELTLPVPAATPTPTPTPKATSSGCTYPLDGCSCDRCAATRARNTIHPYPGCNCGDCVAARQGNSHPKPGCNCEKCLAARGRTY